MAKVINRSDGLLYYMRADEWRPKPDRKISLPSVANIGRKKKEMNCLSGRPDQNYDVRAPHKIIIHGRRICRSCF